MTSINYMRVLSDEEVKEIRKKQISLVKKVLDGRYGLVLANMLSSFLQSLENLIESELDKKCPKCKKNTLYQEDTNGAGIGVWSVLKCTNCDYKKDITDYESW